MFTFPLKELTPQTVLRFGCVLVAFWSKTFLKSILTTKWKTVWFVTTKRTTVWKPELESAPQRETQTQQLSWLRCCTRCGARLTDATTPYNMRRSIATGTSSWSYRTHMTYVRTPSEEMIPHRLWFKIASHVRMADRADPLFKFGGWNRVAENCWELGRFKKRPVLGGCQLGTTTQTQRNVRVCDLLKGCRRIFVVTLPSSQVALTTPFIWPQNCSICMLTQLSSISRYWRELHTQHAAQEQANNQTGADPVPLLGCCELITWKIRRHPKIVPNTHNPILPNAKKWSGERWCISEKKKLVQLQSCKGKCSIKFRLVVPANVPCLGVCTKKSLSLSLFSSESRCFWDATTPTSKNIENFEKF